MRKKNFEGKIVGVSSSLSGIGSIISAHNVCHTLCIAAIAILSVFGIMASSDIFMFLENYNLLFWGMGLLFLALSLFLYVRTKGCMSKKLILVNVGLLIAGMPFFQAYNIFFWVTGLTITGGVILWHVRDVIAKKM